MAIVANKDDDLKYKKQQIELYFSIHPEETDRAEYLKSAYQDRYTEILVDGVRVGYKPQADGLLMWEGAYLSRTSESVFHGALLPAGRPSLLRKRNTSSIPKSRRRRAMTASSYPSLILRILTILHRKMADRFPSCRARNYPNR